MIKNILAVLFVSGFLFFVWMWAAGVGPTQIDIRHAQTQLFAHANQVDLLTNDLTGYIEYLSTIIELGDPDLNRYHLTFDQWQNVTFP